MNNGELDFGECEDCGEPCMPNQQRCRQHDETREAEEEQRRLDLMFG